MSHGLGGKLIVALVVIMLILPAALGILQHAIDMLPGLIALAVVILAVGFAVKRWSHQTRRW